MHYEKGEIKQWVWPIPTFKSHFLLNKSSVEDYPICIKTLLHQYLFCPPGMWIAMEGAEELELTIAV